MIDDLQSAEMVGADGIHVTVSPTSYSDLWWGIRGAGANFGVITSATFKIHPLENNGDVFLADFYLPAERSREYFEMVETHFSPMPARLAQILVVSWNVTTNSVSPPHFPWTLPFSRSSWQENGILTIAPGPSWW